MAELHITVCISPAARVLWTLQLTLPEGSSVQDALHAALQQPVAQAWPWPTGAQHPVWASWTPGIWNRACGWDTPLRDGDRVELYRPLRVDPKVARRERFQKQGARSAGLFAARRPKAPPRPGPG